MTAHKAQNHEYIEWIKTEIGDRIKNSEDKLKMAQKSLMSLKDYETVKSNNQEYFDNNRSVIEATRAIIATCLLNDEEKNIQH